MVKALMAFFQEAWRIIRQAWAGFWEDDGFIFSGHLAYLSLLTLFPFLIFMVSLAGAFGRTTTGLEVVQTLLATLPGNVAEALTGPINQVIGHKGRSLLTFGIVIALWTAASFIETVRVIIHKAYNHTTGRSIWQYRLQSFVIVIGSAILLLVAMTAQFAVNAVWRLLTDHWAMTIGASSLLSVLRLGIAPLGLFIGLYGLFLSLTPRRAQAVSHWPGAILTLGVWLSAASLLPRIISGLGGYDVTYGSLAGVMITLVFFYVVGVGLVMGAQVNAALRPPTQS